MSTKTVVVNEGTGLLLVKLMYRASATTISNSGAKVADYSIDEKYLAAGSRREYELRQFQYLLVEEVHP